MELSRLASRENYRQVEKEWQLEFIYYVLESMGVPEEMLSEWFPEEGMEAFTVAHRIELRKQMKLLGLKIIDDLDGGLKMYFDDDANEGATQLIAEWKKCKFILREDPAELERINRLFIEIKADVWTSFDEEEDE